MPRRNNECRCCGCKPLHQKEWTTSTQGESFTSELTGAPSHLIELSLSGLERATGDSSGSDFRIDPFRVDVLYGCDNEGNDPLLKLRVRMEHGEILSMIQNRPVFFGFTNYGNWSSAALKSHAMSMHKDTPGLPIPVSNSIQMVECNVYLELFDEQGSQLSSVLIPQIPGEFVQIKLNVGFAEDGDSLVSTVKYDTFAPTVSSETAPFVELGGMRHTFDSYSPTDSLWRGRSHCKVVLTAANRLSVTAKHSALTRAKKIRTFERPIEGTGGLRTENISIDLSPETPADLDPFCDSENSYFQSTRMVESRPWLKKDHCEFSPRNGRVYARTPSFDPTTMTMTITGDGHPLTAGLVGVFDLSGESLSQELVDNTFAGRRTTNSLNGLGINQEEGLDATFNCVTEWSAMISVVDGVGLVDEVWTNRCRTDWAKLLLCGRAAYIAPTGKVFTVVYHETLDVDASFFSGNEITLIKSIMLWTEHGKKFGSLTFPFLSPWHCPGWWPYGGIGTGMLGETGLQVSPVVVKLQLKE